MTGKLRNIVRKAALPKPSGFATTAETDQESTANGARSRPIGIDVSQGFNPYDTGSLYISKNADNDDSADQ